MLELVTSFIFKLEKLLKECGLNWKFADWIQSAIAHVAWVGVAPGAWVGTAHGARVGTAHGARVGTAHGARVGTAHVSRTVHVLLVKSLHNFTR